MFKRFSLEEQTRKRTVESFVLVKNSQLSADNESSPCDGNSDGSSDSALLEIEARVLDKDVLVRNKELYPIYYTK